MKNESDQSPEPRAYEAVLASIEADLRAGRLGIGDRLPGERTLSARHSVSRASVRDAIRVLDVMGVVRTSTGSGPTAGAVVISNPTAGLSAALRLHVATRHLPVADIVQARIMMETWAAEAAMQRPVDTERVQEAAELLEKMDRADLSREEFHTLDAQFHVLLSAMAGNTVVAAMMESLRLSIMDYVRAAVPDEDTWTRVAAVLRRQHHDILAAIVGRDGTLAARLLREHIEWFFTATQPS